MTSTCDNRNRRHEGFTLAELLVSVVSMAVLMVGIGSAILLATHSIDDGQTPSARTHQAAAAADRIIQDVGCALTVSEASSTALTFTVADRDSDEQAETIRYAWSGTAGDPLTVQYNGGTIIELVQDVYEFDLGYTVRSITETVEDPGSGEVRLSCFYDWTEMGITADPDPKAVWTSEYFMAEIPAEATQLTITRVKLKLRQGPIPSESRIIAIHEAVGGANPGNGDPEPLPNPIGTPVSIPAPEMPLTFDDWTTITFSDVVIDSPGKEYCIVTKCSTPTAGEVLFLFSRSAPDDFTTPVGLWSMDLGATWDPATNKRNQYDMPFEVYGSYTTGGPPQPTTRDWLCTVDIKLRRGTDPSTRIDTAVEILNTPEVTGL